MDEARLLEQQRAYYRARASEYESWWLREGRYDHGAEANRRWFDDVERVTTALDEFGPRGRVLELACGTGLWTRKLVRYADTVLAVDAAPEVIELNRARVDGRVDFLQADLFQWSPPPGAFDVCFFGFWLSHVPEGRFESFWSNVRTALAPGGRVFFVDSARNTYSGAVDHRSPADDDEVAIRRLDDGSEFRIIKRFYEPRALEQRLAELGWTSRVRATPEFFIFASASPR